NRRKCYFSLGSRGKCLEDPDIFQVFSIEIRLGKMFVGRFLLFSNCFFRRESGFPSGVGFFPSGVVENVVGLFSSSPLDDP
ncbi:hypothetical protein L9F63_026590, partial [Diploptera punctata]